MKKLILFIFIFLSFIWVSNAWYDIIDTEPWTMSITPGIYQELRITMNQGQALMWLLGNNSSIGCTTTVRLVINDIGQVICDNTVYDNLNSTLAGSWFYYIVEITETINASDFNKILPPSPQVNKIAQIMWDTSSWAINTGTETMDSNFWNIIYFIIWLALISLILFLFYYYIEKKGK